MPFILKMEFAVAVNKSKKKENIRVFVLIKKNKQAKT